MTESNKTYFKRTCCRFQMSKLGPFFFYLQPYFVYADTSISGFENTVDPDQLLLIRIRNVLYHTIESIRFLILKSCTAEPAGNQMGIMF